MVDLVKHLETSPRPCSSIFSKSHGVQCGNPLSNMSSWPRFISVHPSSFVKGFVVMTDMLLLLLLFGEDDMTCDKSIVKPSSTSVA